MAEGAGTSQRSVFLAKRDDATESELHRLLEIRRRNPVKAARGLGSPLSAEFGSYAALVNPPERGRTDVVLTGPHTHIDMYGVPVRNGLGVVQSRLE